MDNSSRSREDDASRRLLGDPMHGGGLGQVHSQGLTVPQTHLAMSSMTGAQDLAAPLPPHQSQLLDLGPGPSPGFGGQGQGQLYVPSTNPGALSALSPSPFGGNTGQSAGLPAATMPGFSGHPGGLGISGTASFAPGPGGLGGGTEITATSPSVHHPGMDEATHRFMGYQASSSSAAQVEGLRRRGHYSETDKHATSREAKRAAELAEAEVTCFKVVINGEIESAQLSGGNRGPLMCVFSVQHGADWTIVSGTPNGITQVACSAAPLVNSISATIRSGGMREVVWNFPIGLVFKSTSPFGWPRLAVTVYGTDMCNRRVLKGYGSVHIPCQPGRHTRVIRLYCPLSSSPLTRLLGALFGNPAQLVDPRMITGTEGREVIRVQSGGKVRATFEILLKDVEPFNYSF